VVGAVVVVVGRVVVVVLGGRVVVVVLLGRVVVVVCGRVVVVVAPRVVVEVGEPSLVVVAPSMSSLVDVLELEVDEELVVLRSWSSAVVVELVVCSTWWPRTSTGCVGSSSERTPASIATAPTQAASTHQNHRPSRTRCTGRRYRGPSCDGDITRSVHRSWGGGGRRCAGRLVGG
jgi:hypothetical protein